MNRKTIGQRAIASTGIVGLTSVLQFATGFGLQVVLARLLAPEVFGQFAFVLLVQGLVASFRTIQAGEFLICKKGDWRQAYDTVFTTDLTLSALTTVLVVAFAGPLMRAAGQPELSGALRISILACILMPFAIPSALFQREIDFAATARARVAGLVVGPLSKIGLALAGFGLFSLVIGELVRQAVEIAILWAMARERPALGFDRATFFEALRFSLPLSLNGLLVYYYWKVDDFVVGRMLGMEELGYYWLAFRIPEYMLTLRGHFVPVVFATFARLESLDDQKLAYARLTRLTTLAFFPIALVSLVHGDHLIISLFGEKWAPAVPAFQLLMLTGALRMSTGYAGDLFKVSGRTWVFPLTSVFNASLLTAGVVGLTRRAGITGTGLAVLLMILASLPLTEVLLWRWFRVSPCRLLLRPVAALAVATLGGVAVRAAWPGLTLPFAAANAAAWAAVDVGLALLLDRELVDDVRWVWNARLRQQAPDTL